MEGPTSQQIKNVANTVQGQGITRLTRMHDAIGLYAVKFTSESLESIVICSITSTAGIDEHLKSLTMTQNNAVLQLEETQKGKFS